MKKSILKIVVGIVSLLLILIGCSKDNSPQPTSGVIETDLIKIEDALNHPNANFVNLVNNIRGSVGTNSVASRVIWSRKNNFNLGLFVSANHVYGIGTWPSLNEEFIDLMTINNGIYGGSKIPSTNGSVNLPNELIAGFGLYHPYIPSNVTNTTILPENDFYLGIIDNQRIADNGFGVYPNLVQTSTPLQMFDPSNRTLSNQTWSVPNAGDMVIAIGYPQDRVTFPNGAVSSGKVYSDAEAEDIIDLLQFNGDEEGDIPYNPEVEFLANVQGVAGMSGGGVFNANGQLLGVIVRGTILNDEPMMRVVKMSYVVQKLNNFYNTLSLTDKNKIFPFISGELN